MKVEFVLSADISPGMSSEKGQSLHQHRENPGERWSGMEGPFQSSWGVTREGTALQGSTNWRNNSFPVPSWLREAVKHL